jgi:two-component system LytT family sensor kinase
MRKAHAVILHLIFWAYKLGWGTLMETFYKPGFSINFKEYFLPYNISTYIYQFSTFYINYFLIMPLFFARRKYIRLTLSWVCLFAYFIGIRYFIEEYLYFKWFGTHNYFEGTTGIFYIVDNLYFAGSIIIPSIAIYIVVHWMKVEKQQLQLKEVAAATEVNFLKSQVNPHFMYNTLNNIYSLVYHQSEKALPAIMRLSELMRYMTRDSTVDKIALLKELKYIESFLELESLRVAGEAQVSFTTSGATDADMIAPLLLIPFVENGFKHGIVTQAENPFIIELHVHNKELKLFTSNKINHAQKDHSSGIGLQNVKRRLDLIYPGQYHLETGKQGDNYICNLTIKL